ncbi:glycoside hydrolase [Haloferax mucosum ATCC BAA-1512]|uniref:Glycoside hydrolase n=1 Tax=Haloferax mucosum ATCC BAA-1512 TaxID=662479 RepID=M0IGB0_9EURY|nr:LamG domain-containing protein [Haloferax mucosum]ELZ95806.1 glycoside hydrolase [Haloferax mucosum ATCC BAA-1512]
MSSRRTHRNSARRGDSGLSRRAFLAAGAGLLGVGLAGPNGSDAYTTAAISRGSSLPIATDDDGLLEIDAVEKLSPGRRSELVSVRNRFGRTITATVSVSTPGVSLTTDTETGPSVSTMLTSGERVVVDATVEQSSPAVGGVLSFVVEATVDGTTARLSRSVPVERTGIDGLIARWPFDTISRGRSPDVIGGRDLTASGNVRVSSGRIGSAVELRGNGYLERRDGALNGLDAFTLSVWVKSDRTSYDGGIVFGARPDGRDDVLGLRYDRDGAFAGSNGVFYPRNIVKASVRVGGAVLQFESERFLQTTDWQHLVLTWESGEPLRLYADGEPVSALFLGYDGGTPAFGNYPTGVTTGSDRILVGQGSKNDRWDGHIDDLRLYDRRLSDADVRALYEE